MEKEKKPHTFLKLFIGFLLGIAVCIGALYAANNFNLLNKFIKCETAEKKETQKDTSKDTTDTTPVEKTSVTAFYPNSIAVLHNGKVYVNVYGSTPEVDDLFGGGTYQTLVNTRKNYQPINIQNSSIKSGNEELKFQELTTSNVSGVFIYEAGQTINKNYSLLLVKEDGKVEIISLYSLITGRSKTTELKGLENIAYFTSKDNDGINTYAIDKDGNELNLNNIIPDNYKDY